MGGGWDGGEGTLRLKHVGEASRRLVWLESGKQGREWLGCEIRRHNDENSEATMRRERLRWGEGEVCDAHPPDLHSSAGSRPGVGGGVF